MKTQSIVPGELARLRGSRAGMLLLDVRTPAEFNDVHAEGARLMPLDRLDVETVRRAAPADMPVFVICRTGSRAREAAQRLGAAGVDATVIEGGTLAWDAAGLPVKRGRPMISLDRQVRIAAGSLVLGGVLLGFFVHTGFVLVSGFIGCGLIFAGVTDICGMALLLGRMPWNQARVAAADLLTAAPSAIETPPPVRPPDAPRATPFPAA